MGTALAFGSELHIFQYLACFLDPNSQACSKKMKGTPKLQSSNAYNIDSSMCLSGHKLRKIDR